MTARKTDFRLIMESKADGSYIGIPTSILVGEQTDFTHQVSEWMDKYNIPEISVDYEEAEDLLFLFEQKTGRTLELLGEDEEHWVLGVFPKVNIHVQAIKSYDFVEEEQLILIVLGIIPEHDVTEHEIEEVCAWLNGIFA